jgi:CHAT domain-containing protein/Tfp pilus assembly protein PilF
MNNKRFLALFSAVALISIPQSAVSQLPEQSVPPATSSSSDRCALRSPDRSRATAQVLEGISYRSTGQLDEAIARFDAALAICPNLSFALYQRGATLAQQRRWDEAVADYRQAIATFEDTQESYEPGLSLAQIRESLAEALRRGSTTIPASAQNEYNLAIRLYRQSADYRNLGRLLRQLGRYEEAIAEYRRATQVITERSLLAEVYYGLAQVLLEQPQTNSDANATQSFEEAIAALSQALDLWQAEYDAFPNLRPRYSQNLANAYDARAIAYRRLNQPELAQQDEDTANQIRIGESECSTVNTCIELGRSLRQQGRRDEAIAQYDRAIEMIAQEPDISPSLEATAYNNRGVARSELIGRNHLEQAIADYQAAIDLAPTAIQYVNLGNALIALNRRSEAEAAYRQVKSLLEDSVNKIVDSFPGRVDSQSLLATLLLQQEGYQTYRDLAVSLSSTQDFYDFYIDVLMQLHEENPTERFDIEALEVSERARARGLIELLTDADIYQRIGDDALAEQERSLRAEFSRLVEQWKQLNGEPFNPDLLSPPMPVSRTDVTDAPPDPTPLDDVTDAPPDTASSDITLSNDPVLLDLPSFNGDSIADLSEPDTTSPNATAEADAKREALLNQIQETAEQYEQLWEQISEVNPEYSQINRPPQLNFNHQETIDQLLLDDNTLLLEYSLGERHSYLWVISAAGVETYQLPSRGIIQNAAQEFVESLKRTWAAPNYTAYQGLPLSQMLLGCIADRLDDQRLVIVADGALRYVPFSALPVPTPSQTCNTVSGTISRDRNLPSPLITRHEIVNLPSASTLALLRQRERDERRRRIDADDTQVAVIADPVFTLNDERLRSPGDESGSETGTASATQERSSPITAGNFPRLPGTRQEAEQIEQAAEDDGFAYLSILDFDATFNTIFNELSDYQIIHFATHGFLDDRQPENSGLVLSQFNAAGIPQGDNGFLRMEDVFALEPILNADLIVLSGCRTGLGTEIGGEGLLSLTQGFMYAGVNSIVVSLWSVNDEATAELMGEFYHQLLDRQRPPSEALRAAQIHLLENSDGVWRNPYYWAAFTLQGEWQ